MTAVPGSGYLLLLCLLTGDTITEATEESGSGDTITDATEESGSGEAWDSMVEPVVALVKRSQQSDLPLGSLWGFIGNTLRLSFIIFIPALLLTVGYRFLLLLCLLTAAECDQVVFATVGYNVTLPRKYDVQANGLSSTCWGQGAIPASRCSNQLIASDGATVRKVSQVSSRYQLLGDLENGDVSMTILNVSEMDSGQYGCRVEIAGWWNDLKHHFQLKVRKDTKPTPKRKLDDVSSTEQTILKTRKKKEKPG
ncbi:unnamed protein product, partial [Arctogadus glacialis]